jgi:membrane fusion protein
VSDEVLHAPGDADLGSSQGGIERLVRTLDWRPGVALLASLAALVVGALAFTLVTRVEQSADARGILRVAGGAQVVCIGVAGTVASIAVSPGAAVNEGDVLARLQSEPLEADLLEARQALDLATEARLHYETVENPRSARERALLRQKNAAHGLRRPLHQRALENARARASLLEGLLARGEVNSLEYLGQQERVDSEREHIFTLDQDSRQFDLELLTSEDRDDLRDRETARAVLSAGSRLREVELQLRQTVVVAPIAGAVDAVLARPGDRVQAGSQLLRLVPSGRPLEVVAFLPERYRAAVSVGGSARVTFDQLPTTDYPPLSATLVRVASNIASEEERRDALGEQSSVSPPSFRVELALQDGASAHYPLRHGMFAQVYLSLHRRRLASVLFEPLRRWLE